MSSTNSGLPTVQWGTHTISLMIMGHNPFKGHSHFSQSLDAEMKEWHQENHRIVATLKRCEECGVNTMQFGGEVMHKALNTYLSNGGEVQWIATLYGNETGNLGVGTQLGMEEELSAILAVKRQPIGIQHFGEKTDRLFFAGKLDLVRERMKRLRDTGLLIGVCTHLPHVAEEIAAQGWDIDFYQTPFYTVYSHTGQKAVDRKHEVFDDQDRERMVQFIQHIDKPCIAFKVLAANRKCQNDQALESALRFAFEHIKASDIVCVGMWQKYKDQVAQNVSLVSHILNNKVVA